MGTRITVKSISTLVPDVLELLKTDGWFTDELAAQLAKGMQFQFNIDENAKRDLTMSRLGPRCPKALWHSVRTPELAQDLRPQTKLMFKYGHIIEQLAISLFKAAGHHVTGEQDECELDGIKGHRDCVVDGAILDVKSCGLNGFKSFAEGTIAQDDKFGYLDQLDGYLCASLSDPLVTVKDRAYLFAIEKQLGHICLYEHKFREKSIRQRVSDYKDIVSRSSAPTCCCGTLPDGESGNIKLDVAASYNVFKHVCFPNLRTFIYAGGKPRFFTKVVKRPTNKGVPLLEVDKFGKPVYN